MHANVLDGGGYTQFVKEAHRIPLLRERIYEVVHDNPPVARHSCLVQPGDCK